MFSKRCQSYHHFVAVAKPRLQYPEHRIDSPFPNRIEPFRRQPVRSELRYLGTKSGRVEQRVDVPTVMFASKAQASTCWSSLAGCIRLRRACAAGMSWAAALDL